MRESCVMVPFTYMELQRKYPHDSPCNHCYYHQYGCPNVKSFTIRLHKFIAIEKDADELPKCGIWCKNCKDRSGKIFHKTLFNGRFAFAVRCPRCGGEFVLYESKVRQEYTGFINGNGEFVSPNSYGTSKPTVKPIVKPVSVPQEKNIVYSSRSTNEPTAMEIALRKAGLL